ncbi:MAG: hypothetical protein ABIG61_17925, partial [Planctomycetota bacterium]
MRSKLMMSIIGVIVLTIGAAPVLAASFVDALIWWHMDEYASGPLYTGEDLRDYNGDNTTFAAMRNQVGPVWVQGPTAGPGGGSTFLTQPAGTGGAVQFRKDRGEFGDEVRFGGDDLLINGEITLWFRLKIDRDLDEWIATDPCGAMTIAQNLHWQGGKVIGWLIRIANDTNVAELNWLWGQNEQNVWNQVWTGEQMPVEVNEWIDISACVDTVNREARVTCYSAGDGFDSAVYSFDDANVFTQGQEVKGLVNFLENPTHFTMGADAYEEPSNIDMTVESAAMWDFALSMEDVEALSYYEFLTACG